MVPQMLKLLVEALGWEDVGTGRPFMSGDMLHTCLLQAEIMAQGLISGMS